MFTVGIIVQSWHYFADPFKLQPLWELYFATAVQSRLGQTGVQAHVIDLRESRRPNASISLGCLAKAVPEHDLFFLWVQKTADVPEALDIARQLREAYPEAKLAVGGTQADVFAQEFGTHFDIVVLGPAEESLVQIVEAMRAGSVQRVYRDDWRARNYDAYPIALRSFLPHDSIVNRELFKQYGGVPGTSAMLQRGCSFRCAYCIYNVPGHIQSRSPARIREEIDYLKREYHIQGLNLRDEIAIPLDPAVARPFLEALGAGSLRWRGQTKIGSSPETMVPKDVIRLAAESGCVELSVGVETASQDVMDLIGKRQDLSQVTPFIEHCHEFGIRVKMCLILGLPGEPRDIVSRTIGLIRTAQPDFVNVSGFCPVPGSPIARHPQRFGIKSIETDWRKHAHLMLRFEDEEHFGLPFEYQREAPWGTAFSRAEIIENIRGVQHYLRERQMVY